MPAVSAAIVLPIGLGVAGTAYASADSAKAPTVSESTEHGPGHARPEGVEHGPGHERPGGSAHGEDHEQG
jgi:hypothetical protein